MRVGFVTWDGPAQNYMESLFLPIFGKVAELGDYTFSTLQFTWDFDTSSIESASEQLGFGYRAKSVLRKPLKPATALMMVKGARDVANFVRDHDIDILMPRSIITAAMVLGAKRATSDVLTVFDADGFVADERVDFAGWDEHGFTYRLFRDIEAEMARSADSTMVRTRRARDILIARAGSGMDPASVFVISNGKDEELFRPADRKTRQKVREELGVQHDAPWIVYVGSLGPQYHPVEMARFFRTVHRRRPDARLLVLTGQQDEMRRHLRGEGVDRSTFEVRRVPADDVPRYLASADLGLAFREPTFSQRAVAPIKVGEYLLTGLPVAATTGVGDVDDQIDETVGFLLDGLGDARLDACADWFIEDVINDREGFRDRCRARGLAEFSMRSCAERYLAALKYATESRDG